MTTSTTHADNREQKVKDRNQDRRLKAVTNLQRLLAVVADPNFVGIVRLEIPGKKGSIGTIRSVVEQLED